MYVHCSESTTQVVALGSALLYVSSPSHRARGVHLKSLYEYHQFKKVNLSQYTRNSVSHATLWRASGCCTAGERHHQAHLRIRGRAGCRAAARRPAAVGRLPHLRHELPAGRRRQHRHQRAQAGGHCINEPELVGTASATQQGTRSVTHTSHMSGHIQPCWSAELSMVQQVATSLRISCTGGCGAAVQHGGIGLRAAAAMGGGARGKDARHVVAARCHHHDRLKSRRGRESCCLICSCGNV